MSGFNYGHQVMTATISSGETATSAYFVGGYNHVSIEIPTFAVGLITATANVYIQGCQTATGTFRRIKDVGVYSAASGIYDWEVPSTVGGYLVICRPAERFNYIKVETNNAATGGSGTYNGYPVYVHVHN